MDDNTVEKVSAVIKAVDIMGKQISAEKAFEIVVEADKRVTMNRLGLMVADTVVILVGGTIALNMAGVPFFRALGATVIAFLAYDMYKFLGHKRVKLADEMAKETLKRALAVATEKRSTSVLPSDLFPKN